MTKINPDRIDAADIRRAMTKRWSAPEWAIMWEVANSTGAGAMRSADAVMMSLWPSRGLELHGVEIKVSRSDWKREARDPSKAEAVAAYCDRWWIHTPVGVVDDVSDLPPAWGLRELAGKRWNTIKEADKTDAKPVGRSFLASLLRRSDTATRALARDSVASEHEALQEIVNAERAKLREAVNREVERRTRDYKMLKDKVDAFEQATGAEVVDFVRDDLARIGRCAVALSRACGPVYAGVERQAIQLECAAKALRDLHAMGSIEDAAGHIKKAKAS